MADWFRKTEWNSEAAADFERRLARSRRENRLQYVLVQAATLLELRDGRLMSAALELLDRHSQLAEDRVSLARWKGLRAQVLVRIGDIECAAREYERALLLWTEHGRCGDLSYIEYAELVIAAHIEHAYARALDMLARHANESGFPRVLFRERAAWARLANLLGDRAAAQLRARQALDQARMQVSPYQKHQHLGLVEGVPSADLAELESLAAGLQ